MVQGKHSVKLCWIDSSFEAEIRRLGDFFNFYFIPKSRPNHFGFARVMSSYLREDL